MARPTFLSRDFLTGGGALGFALVLGVAALVVLAPVIAPRDPLAIVGRPLTWPFQDSRLPLGTDMLGRDLWAGLVHGARVSLLTAGVATAAAVTFGTAIGAVAGWYRGRLGAVLMRLTDAVQTVPGFVLALTLVAVLGPGQSSTLAAIAAVSWTGVARVVRAEVLSLSARGFVLASRALGMGDGALLVRRVLPPVLAPVAVLATAVAASAILIESALAFLGLGDPNRPSWGAMIGAGRAVLRSAWYVSALPGAAIAVTVLGIGLLGEGLARALDPRRRAARPKA